MPTVGKARMPLLGWVCAIGIAWPLFAACGATCPSSPADSRLEPAADMVSRRELIGLTDEELVNRLGSGTNQKTFPGWDHVYYLGPDRACVDSRWLVVRLDADRRVAAAEIQFD